MFFPLECGQSATDRNLETLSLGVLVYAAITKSVYPEDTDEGTETLIMHVVIFFPTPGALSL